MQTKNLGFTCGRLSPETYKTLIEAGKRRDLKTNKVIELLVEVVSTVVANQKEYLTPEGREALGKLLGPGQ